MVRTLVLFGLLAAAAAALIPLAAWSFSCVRPAPIVETLTAEAPTSNTPETCLIAEVGGVVLIPCGAEGTFDDEHFQRIN